MMRRRIFAALVLFGVALGSALYWNDGKIDLTLLAINIAAASIGFSWLHHRWKRKEARIITPQKAEDIFS
ncbi:MAG: hypothetical protein AAF687_12950 [Pseudomonadota bacterium]